MAPTRFPILRFMAVLKAARDFGIDPEVAAAIAVDYNPTHGSAGLRRHEQLVDALARSLVESGAVTVPDHA